MRTKILIGSASAIVLLIAAAAFAGAFNWAGPTVAPEPVEPVQLAEKAEACCADCCPECLACCAEDGCCPECILCCIAMGCDPSGCFPPSTSAPAIACSTKSIANTAKAEACCTKTDASTAKACCSDGCCK